MPCACCSACAMCATLACRSTCGVSVVVPHRRFQAGIAACRPDFALHLLDQIVDRGRAVDATWQSTSFTASTVEISPQFPG
jgi:hypothetical protein